MSGFIRRRYEKKATYGYNILSILYIFEFLGKEYRTFYCNVNKIT